MKKIASMIIVAIITVTSCISLSACGGTVSAEQPMAVCYVVANTANAKSLNMSSALVQDTAYEAIINYGIIGVVNADSESELVMLSDYNIKDVYKNASKSRLESDAKRKTTEFSQFIQNVKADDPEVDFLQALVLAERALVSLGKEFRKKIIVLGTGLSTTGVMDFRQNLLSADADHIADLLAERQAIPDFTGITVEWQQLGDVAYPQQDLSASQRIRLEEIYQAIVERGNGSFICNESLANPTNEYSDYPEVSVVELPKEAPIAFDPKQNTVEFEAPMIISEEQVCFVPDTADYLYGEDAIGTLQPIAEFMINEDKDITLVLAGCVAGDETTEYGYDLSRRRAAAVKQTLMDLGVQEERLITMGLGSSDPWHIFGVGVESPLASQNRKVVLLDHKTEAAQELLQRK